MLPPLVWRISYSDFIKRTVLNWAQTRYFRVNTPLSAPARVHRRPPGDEGPRIESHIYSAFIHWILEPRDIHECLHGSRRDQVPWREGNATSPGALQCARSCAGGRRPTIAVPTRPDALRHVFGVVNAVELGRTGACRTGDFRIGRTRRREKTDENSDGHRGNLIRPTR